jgi:transcriptional regulator GlxA family with amidase domain
MHESRLIKQGEGSTCEIGQVVSSKQVVAHSLPHGGEEVARRQKDAQAVKLDIYRGIFAMTLVEILILEGASPSSAAVTVELLFTANRIRRSVDRPAPFQIQLTGSGASNAMVFLGAPANLAGDRLADVVVVPGLGLADEAALSEGLARTDAEDARRHLRQAEARGAEIASSCSGVFLLASAGLLEGRRATTSWWLAPLFRRLYPAVKLDTDAMVARDGRITTAGAAMAQFDLMLAVIAQQADADLAARCARYLLVEPRSSQARYMAIGFLTANDERISQAERWARCRLAEAFSTGDLADAAGLTARTFARRLERVTGLSPVRFVQRLRIEQAIALLETTRLSLDEISRRVGYAEPSTLRRLLRRQGARSAREIRSDAVDRQA